MSPMLRCGLDGASDVARRRRLIRELYEAVEESRELDDGYAFRIPGDEAHTLRVFEFIAFERTCCPFLSFELDLAPEHGPLWLAITGPSGTKEFAHRELAAGGLRPERLRLRERERAR